MTAREWLANAWERLCAVVRGAKTLATCFVVGLIGVLDQFSMIEIMTWAKELFGDNARTGVLLLILAVVFLALRIVTAGPIAGRTKEEA